MSIHALHIGINKYKGATLRGCVNDAKAMAGFFKRAESRKVLLDKDATRKNILAELAKLLKRLKADDWGVITFSGHGTWLPDESGDESDGRDEALVCADLKLIVDDDFGKLLSKRHPASRLFVVTDSCHSGTVHRFFSAAYSRVRFMPCANFASARSGAKRVQGYQFGDWTRSVARRLMARKAAALPNVIHYSGCEDWEYSYDANFKGKPYGALTWNLLDCFKAKMTFGDWYGALCQRLPSSEYPQSPCCNASAANLRLLVP